MAGADRRPEGPQAGKVLPSGQRRCGQPRKLAPDGRAGIHTHRLLHPAEPKIGRRRQEAPRRFRGKRLVGVRMQRFPGLQAPGERADQRQVAIEVETDLDLEVAVAGRAGLRHDRFGVADMNAAGIGAHRARRIGRQRHGKRHAAAAGGKVPIGHVETGDHLRIGAGLPGLQHEYVRCRGQFLPKIRRIGQRPVEDARRDIRDKQAGAMLRAAGRPVAPDLSPADQARIILQPHQHGRPVPHRAEGRRDRLFERHTEDMRLNGPDHRGTGGTCLAHGILTPQGSRRRRHRPYRWHSVQPAW